jgi:hypothetical protein
LAIALWRQRQKRSLKAGEQAEQGRCGAVVVAAGKWLRQVITGYFNYYPVPTNIEALRDFRDVAVRLWRRSLALAASSTAGTGRR